MSYRRLAEALLEGRPYFGPAMRSLQGLATRHKYILPVVRKLARRSRIEILEVGSWAGASAISWASALKRLGIRGRVTCVDPWLPYFDVENEQISVAHYERMNDAAHAGAIRKLFEHNVACAGFCDVIVAREGKSSEVLPEFPAQGFDIIYLDGSHAYEDVVFDLRQAKRLVRPGGVICGDDLERQLADLNPAEVQAAVRRRLDFVSSNGSDYHPGITLAVAEELGEVSSWDGFWAISFSDGKSARLYLDIDGEEVPEHLAATSVVIEADTPKHHVISTDGRFYGVAKALGPPDITAELLGDTDLSPFIFTGATRDEVLAKIRHDDEQREAPLLVGSHRDYNMVHYRGRIYALRQSLGYVDVAADEAEIARRFGEPDLLIGDSVDKLRTRIDAFDGSDGPAGEQSDMQMLRDEIVQWQRRVDTDLKDIAARLKESLTALERGMVAGKETNKNLGAQLEQVQAQLRALAEEFTQRDYGPAGDQPPLLLELYRDFKLLRHGNRIFAVRQTLGDVNVLVENSVLEAHYAGEDVIAGESLDGVKARIDALHAEQTVRELTARLEKLDKPRRE